MSDKHCVWENATTYSRGEDKTEIRTTKIKAGELTITVTKYVGCGDELVMHCPLLGISTRLLNTEDMAEGQKKALAIAESRISKIAYSLKAMQENQSS